jgi:uncharacterized protein (DUF697 family)
MSLMALAAPPPASEVRRFDPPNFLWHFGAVVAIFATAWVAGDSSDRYGDGGLLGVSAAFFATYALGAALLTRRGWRAPGGVLATLAVAAVPLLVYSIQKVAGLWPELAPDAYGAFHQEIHAAWIAMELATVAVGLVAFALLRYPLILAPVCFVAWYMTMDLAPAFFGRDVTDDERAGVSIVAGLALIAIGIVLDVRGARRAAFWPHVFGFLALLGAICWLTYAHNTTTAWAVVTAISLATIFLAIPLGRSTFAVFGGIGLLSSLCYWSHLAFWDSVLFPIALALVGLAFIALGMLWQARAETWRLALQESVRRARA